ncbi:MAG: hypothetical protein QOF19_1738 [Alphaproteobacteria bacterium]|nr:hypothetical protein [Alphaproteobacteria bacterium]
MTKLPQYIEGSAHPYGGAGAPEIEATTEMVDAGVEQFLRDYPETGTGDELDRRMVRRIFEAMTAASLVSTKISAVY